MPLEILAPLERTPRAEEDHPVVLSHGAKYRSLLPSLALIVHLIDSRGGHGRAGLARRGGAGGRLVPRHMASPFELV